MSLISAGGGDRRAKEIENREWLARAAKGASIYDVHIILGFCLYCLFANSVHFFNPPPSVRTSYIWKPPKLSAALININRNMREAWMDPLQTNMVNIWTCFRSFGRSVDRSVCLVGRTKQPVQKRGRKKSDICRFWNWWRPTSVSDARLGVGPNVHLLEEILCILKSLAKTLDCKWMLLRSTSHSRLTRVTGV